MASVLFHVDFHCSLGSLQDGGLFQMHESGSGMFLEAYPQSFTDFVHCILLVKATHRASPDITMVVDK